MKIVTEHSFSIQIYIAGDLSIIKQECRKYCMEDGFCVTITPTDFIYTGGEESGVCIGIQNYPRFPSTKKELYEKAIRLANELITAAHQWTALVVAPEMTVWLTRREGRDGE